MIELDQDDTVPGIGPMTLNLPADRGLDQCVLELHESANVARDRRLATAALLMALGWPEQSALDASTWYWEGGPWT
jgi:hypothetical protein